MSNLYTNLAVIGLFIISCGPSTVDARKPIPKQNSCTVQNTAEGAEITCPDGSTAVVRHGETEAGEDGENCSVVQTEEGAMVQCGANGANSILIKHGMPGLDGIDGNDGVDGEDFDPCKATSS